MSDDPRADEELDRLFEAIDAQFRAKRGDAAIARSEKWQAIERAVGERFEADPQAVPAMVLKMAFLAGLITEAQLGAAGLEPPSE